MKEAKITLKIDIMLFIIFLMLKLDGIINWQWIWIFSPFWIVLIAQIGNIVIDAILNWSEKQKYKSRVAGDPLVWDAKTNTLYGPFEVEDNVND